MSKIFLTILTPKAAIDQFQEDLMRVENKGPELKKSLATASSLDLQLMISTLR